MNQLYNIIYCTLWADASRRKRICDLPVETILLGHGEQSAGFTRVSYVTTQVLNGWVEDIFLSPLEYSTPQNVVPLDHPTASLQDLNQYVFVDGKVQFNLCGELCVCFVAELGLSDMLTAWKSIPTSSYNRIFHKGMARTTGVPDLLNMMQVSSALESKSLRDIFTVNNRMVITPTRLENVLCFGLKIIVGVRIDQRGRLRRSGVLHWVTITNAVANGFDGWISFYNPASNSIEEMGWSAFSESMGVPFGIAMRKRNEENVTGKTATYTNTG